MVEHVSTGEQENSDQADGSPEVPILNNRSEVWCSNGEEGDETEDGGRDGYSLDIVEWSRYRGLLALRECSTDPGVDRVGGLLSTFCQHFPILYEYDSLPSREVKSCRSSIGLCVWSRGWVVDQ